MQKDFREISDPTAMPEKPLVSVLLFAYRHERFLAQAIEGIISQIRNFPIELIIGEDFSPDGTLGIAVDYQQRHPGLIRVLTGSKNVGGHANVARCKSVSRGKYIALHDGDDYWNNVRKLEMQVNMMESNPEMTFCHTDFNRETRFRTYRSVHRLRTTQWLAEGDAYIPLLYQWSVMTVTAMFRKDVLDAFSSTEFNNFSWPFGDRNLTLYASLNGPVGYIDESTATYRKVRSSAMNAGAISYLRMPTAAYECIDLFLRRFPVSELHQRRIQARLKIDIYRSAFFAERADLMESSHNWLLSNGFDHSVLCHGIRCMAVKLRFPLRVLRSIKNFVDLYLSSIPS